GFPSSTSGAAAAARSSCRSATMRPISLVNASTVGGCLTATCFRHGQHASLYRASRMDFDLEPEQELLRDTVRQFALEKVAPVAEELDREKRFPYELVAEMSELGLMGMTIPEEYEGAGIDTVSYAIAIEELTRIDSSVAITVAAHHSLGPLPISYFGNEEQKRQWL